MRKALYLLSALALSACAVGNYHDYLRMRDIAAPTDQNLTHCYNYGCSKKETINLPIATKTKLEKLFSPAPQTAEEEREKISEAIGIFETDIGEIVGTKNDKYGTFRLYQDNAKSTQTFQQDCIDESTNTTIYLGVLQELKLLKFYEPAFPANRQPFLSGAPWWHQTATISHIETKERYAVDSWFRDNGHAAFIVPLKEWKAGWMAPKLPAEAQ